MRQVPCPKFGSQISTKDATLTARGDEKNIKKVNYAHDEAFLEGSKVVPRLV